MIYDKNAWKIACELARTGKYANVVMIERELRHRGILKGGSVTTHILRRELLTRACHAARNGGDDRFLSRFPSRPFAHLRYAADHS
jgi:hypothetical protein